MPAGNPAFSFASSDEAPVASSSRMTCSVPLPTPFTSESRSWAARSARLSASFSTVRATASKARVLNAFPPERSLKTAISLNTAAMSRLSMAGASLSRCPFAPAIRPCLGAALSSAHLPDPDPAVSALDDRLRYASLSNAAIFMPSEDVKEGTTLKSQESRRRLIHQILHTEKIHSQEALLKRLGKEGVAVTQATLSRDLKFLSVARVPDKSGDYVYTVDAPKETTQDPFIRDDLRREIISIQFSGNLAVVKTKMGYAPGIAYAIDQLKVSEVLGTVGGDDTLLVILKEGADRAKFLRAVTGE